MSFPRYPKYKDSGVEWLGEVPEHWEVSLAKRYLTVKSGDMISAAEETDNGFPLIGGNGMRARTSKYNTEADTLVIGRVGAQCGCVHHLIERFWASEHAFRVIPKQPFSNRFFYYVLSSLGLGQFAIKTAQPLLNTELVEMQWIAVAPRSEQDRIAAFLDTEIGKIDALIAEQRWLIAVLQEKRQAVISHTVTKGLNSGAPMKLSGVAWLGHIPAHWSVEQSRRLFKVRNEPASSNDRQLTASQKYGVVYQSDFVDLEGRRVVEVIKGEHSLRHVEPNDFIISMRSFQGGIEWCRLRGSTSWHYVMLTPVKYVHPPYFAYLLKSSTYIQALRTTTDLIRDGQELRYSHFAQVPLPVVPMDEQVTIADYLDAELGKIDRLTGEAERMIGLFGERRAALISAAVTGKIDVRNYAADQAEAA